MSIYRNDPFSSNDPPTSGSVCGRAPPRCREFRHGHPVDEAQRCGEDRQGASWFSEVRAARRFDSLHIQYIFDVYFVSRYPAWLLD